MSQNVNTLFLSLLIGMLAVIVGANSAWAAGPDQPGYSAITAPQKDRATFTREADARREVEARKREEIQRGFADQSPSKLAFPDKRSEAQSPIHAQMGGSSVDRMTTYASVIGRGMACKVRGASKYAAQVGAWMNREGLSKEYGVIFLERIRVAAEQQYRGETPDSCSMIAARFESFPWP